MSMPSRRSARVIFGKYEMGSLLGEGASAMVFRARHVTSGHTVAIKVFLKRWRLPGFSAPVDYFMREIFALRRLRHRHIICLHEVLASRSKVYLVLEFARGGDLSSRLKSRGHLSEGLCRRIFRQLLSAVAYCHSRGVFHRDLKPDNLLLDDTGNLIVSDFGLSALGRSSSEGGNGDHLLSSQCGTRGFKAPEILSRQDYDGAKVDIWSCGVILFVLNAGYLPFKDHDNPMSLYREIHQGHRSFPLRTPPALRRLIDRLLDPNPATRISIDGILRDPWFATDFDADQWAAMMRARRNNPGAEQHDRRLGGELTAFDMIVSSPGLDLSGLFLDTASRERFASVEPVDKIIDRVEQVGKADGLSVVREEGERRSGAVVEGQNGDVMLKVEVYRLTGDTSVVEVEMEASSGAVGRFWNEKLGPALMDRVIYEGD
ncbi:CBL-interacting serine threonine-protein kinase 11 [Musa troglodytarum]|uniref:non-specific serine/threonine protein kinase n=1 Tax=Musa troglodytarum TaxID=320322 RepID=A0A9E7KDH8_9LILI|nr:CBL-interacting serine threonine-protein kinase 11 [Musa troglodytarum]